MAGPTGGARDRLAKAKEQQSRQETQAAAGEGDEAPERERGGKFGNLAVRAAALIAGQPDPGGGPEDDEDNEDDDGDARREGSKDGERASPGSHDEAGDEEPVDDAKAGATEDVATLDDAAKRLGLTRQEFNALQVQVGSESMTLGELKARLPEVLKLDKARTEFDDARGQWELERIATYRNLTAIVDAIPKNAQTAGLLRQLETQHEATRQRELETLHFARPQWANPTYATGEREKILALAKEYGFTRVEVDALMDHRQVLLVQDYADLRDKVRANRESARKLAEPSGARPTGQAGAAGRDVLPSINGVGRRASKPTREATALRAGAILRKR